MCIYWVRKQVFSSSKGVIVSVLYRPPNTDVNIIIEKINFLMEMISKERKLCYFLGDFNLNILNYDSHSATAEFLDTLFAYATLPLINRPTRSTQSSAMAIDTIFTNDANNFENGCHGILDHFLVFTLAIAQLRTSRWKNPSASGTFRRKIKCHFNESLVILIGLKCTVKATPRRLSPCSTKRL